VASGCQRCVAIVRFDRAERMVAQDGPSELHHLVGHHLPVHRAFACAGFGLGVRADDGQGTDLDRTAYRCTPGIVRAFFVATPVRLMSLSTMTLPVAVLITTPSLVLLSPCRRP
jgi:hypothetical protein